MIAENMPTESAIEIFVPDNLEVSLYATDAALIQLSEHAREQTLVLLNSDPAIKDMRDARAILKALDEWLRPKMQTRANKIEARNNLMECILRLDRSTGAMIADMQAKGLLNGGTNGGDRKSVSATLTDSYTSEGITGDQASRWKLMASLPEEMFEDTVLDAKENAWELTSYDIQRRAREYRGDMPHVLHNAGENEWYTPPEYLAAARRVLGTIDLDPASSKIANKLVQATTYYTMKENGLIQPWQGKVWMNPPYAADLIKQFASKFVQHFKASEITEGIVLVNNATETQWFYDLIVVASAVLFTASRVKFLDEQGNPGAPLQGQAFIYFGGKPKTFMHEFKAFGWGAIL